ncbi:fatty-acyl-CoA synthase [Saccharomonospora amisosensis]|uniref:Fatty-acyl-CoA synthase n=1 Tax=Saccharomonospora amisosensis TaxID=1128677 RepID=A0A7X5URS3_9PSEU|nr:acyl-CoA synthetase [Saccharomonospora amisosensis]NIJ12960.1 fatty-acyl-CoA synthase [Saccharomonospora amisosensis]
MINQLKNLSGRAADEFAYVRLCARSGALRIRSPRSVAGMVKAFARYGTIGALPALAALRDPDFPALVDERGTLTFVELDARINALANAWRDRGLRPGEGVAILARNHRGFLEAVFAAARCGARILLLNTDFAGPQIREVAEREGTDLLVHDEEYSAVLSGVDPPRGRFLAWADKQRPDTLDALIAGGATTAPPAPEQGPKLVLLTSGTTGTPKGAPRPDPHSLAPVGALLSRVPFRAREVTECCAPLFHTLGFAHSILNITLGTTLVLRRRFDALATLRSVREHGSTAMVVVPVMLQRMVERIEADPDLARPPSLRVAFVAGSQLGASLCERAMAAFGPVIYNLYGSTEVAYATVATPGDLRVEPGCVGRQVRGATVKILDEHGDEVPNGRTGRIFVGNAIQFEGYTGGGTKEVIGGLMSSGDVGHIDSHGLLHIDGRDDDMIVSGGENVFPGEVEELLARHDDIVEAAALGVPDDDYGARLRAFVVAREGATLTETDVKEYVRANLARYKVPREVLFLDELPRNPTGKILKRELARYQAGKPA